MKEAGAEIHGLASIFRSAVFFGIALLAILSSNSFYVRLGYESGIKISLVLLMTCYALWGSARRPLSMSALSGWVYWIAALMVVPFLIQVLGGDSIGFNTCIFFVLLGVTPVFFYFVAAEDEVQELFTMFTSCVSFLAIMSLAAWFVGPLMHFVPANCTIMSNWGTQGVWISVDGWFRLAYAKQSLSFMGKGIVRNTSIFTEAPMYSYLLTMALMVEVLGIERRSFFRVVVLAVSILTTFSTTGWCCLVMIALAEYYVRAKRAGRTRTLRFVFLWAILLIGILIVFNLVSDKLDTGSGMTRYDDFRRGYLAWSNNYLFGNGLKNTGIIGKYIGSFRADNTGFSSGIMEILYEGGIAFLMLYGVGCKGYFYGKDSRGRFAVAIFAFLMLVTIVTYLPLTVMFISYGICKSMYRFEEKHRNRSVS